MADRTEIPMSDVLGTGVKVERSWSEDVPVRVGADAPAEPAFDRASEIEAAIKRKREGLQMQMKSEIQREPGTPVNPNPKHHFFVLKGRKLEFIGSHEVEVNLFRNDISGRFFREHLKKVFPGRRDYEDIVSFDGNIKLSEIVKLLELAE